VHYAIRSVIARTVSLTFWAAVLVSCLLASPSVAAATKKKVTLTAFVGAASKPPMQEAVTTFQKKYPNITVQATYGGSGTLLNQMKLEQYGDLYIPGSDDFMDKAQEQKVVLPATRKIVAYLVPTICVQEGNPKKIKSLEDMTRPGITVGLAKPKAVCLGDVSEEIIRMAGLEEHMKANVVNYAQSCELTQQMIQLGEVDAIIGWDSFEAWAPNKIDLVKLPVKLIRVRNIPVAVSVYSKQQQEAKLFISFLTSTTGKAIFSKHGYAITIPKIK
jgi:molybdate transport system substrate-binding protein